MSETRIQLAHGAGGGLTRQLIESEILPRFSDGPLLELPDASLIDGSHRNRLFTTDSYVVQPLVFPGGDIGKLAIYGTVNDIAVAGGQPRWISLALILEEGLELDLLRGILDSIRGALTRCGVAIATGDTKVVARGQCDGMYINTTAIGAVLDGFLLSPRYIQAGDEVLVSGPLGDHGMAVMAAREGIPLREGLRSDAAPLHRLVQAIERYGSGIRFMRDPTRGGVAAVLNEAASAAGVGFRLEEERIPFSPGTLAAAEILGIDLLQVASEGRVLLVCAPEVSGKILATWHALEEGSGAAMIGTAVAEPGRVSLETRIGGRRLVDLPMGEILPRIC